MVKCEECGNEMVLKSNLMIQTLDGELIKKADVLVCQKCGFWKQLDGPYSSKKVGRK